MFSLERFLKAIVLFYLVAAFLGSFLWIALLESGALDGLAIGPLNLAVFKEYQSYLFAGTIGGTLYCLRLFYWNNIRGKLNIRKWWIWYFLRPIMSAGTAVTTIVLFQSGILLIDLSESQFGKVGLAFLIGYGFGKVMDKLDGLTETLFNGSTTPSNRPSDPGKDTSGSQSARSGDGFGNGSANPDQPIKQIKENQYPK